MRLLGTVALSGILGFVVVTGCSATGSDAVTDDASDAAPAQDDPKLPPGSGGGDDSPPPPPPKDAGKDTGVDAGPPPPTPGTSCSEPNKIVSKKCGACGTQSTVCLATVDGGGDGGVGVGTWTDYPPCEGELPGGCIPGTTATAACGNCGTQTKTCSNYCAWTVSACAGQPTDSCVPLSLDFSTAGCTQADTFRQRSCKADCTWNNFSTTCGAAPAIIQVPPTVGSASSTIVTLTSTKTILRLTGDTTCPVAGISPTLATAYEYVQIHNPNAKTATVTIFDSLAPGGVVFHTVLASYNGATPPSTDTARKACVKGMNIFGDDTITGDSNFASLSDTDRPTIPPNGDITIYNAAFAKYDPTKPADSTGSVKLTVQLDALE